MIHKNAWNLIGHDWAVDLLLQHLIHDSARHAYLFSGPQGTGRRTLAIRFIQAMNCPQPTAKGVPCLREDCRTCRQIENLQHPDMKVVQVAEGKSEITIDTIHELQSFLTLAPYEAKYKVGLLINFQHANRFAQNALLKTLEETPDRAKILITTDTPESLLPTIASRCELIRMRPLTLGVVSRGLVHEQQLTESQADFFDHLSSGRYGYAVRLMQDQGFLELRKEVIHDLLAVIQSNLQSRFRLAENMIPVKQDGAARRQSLKTILEIWQSLFRDALMVRVGVNTSVVNTDFLEEINNLADRLSMKGIQKWIDSCDIAIRRIDGYNNPRLVMETFLGELDG